MDRYDRIMLDIRQKTEEEKIHWKVVKADRYSEVLLNSYRVLRAFDSDYVLGDKTYTLLFVEKRMALYDDLNGTDEGIDFQLLVLDEDLEIVVSLYEGVVDRDDFLKLSGLIDENNDRARHFFEAFDESGAA